MKLTVIKENEDGSVDVQLEDISPQMHQLLLQEGLISILKKEMDKAEQEKRIPALFKEKSSAV